MKWANWRSQLDWSVKLPGLTVAGEPSAGQTYDALSSVIPNVPDSVKTYLDLASRLEHVLALLQLAVCGRCFRQVYGRKTILRRKNVHHSGALLRLFSGDRPINEADVIRWQDDIEYGLFHGISTLFATSLTCPDLILDRRLFDDIHSLDVKVNSTERLIASCLLHDFSRSAYDKVEGHDHSLRDYFADLDEETYRHTTPHNVTHPLVAGDRIELLRHNEHSKRVEQDKLNLGENEWKLARLFYQQVRPAMVKLYQYRRARWIRHGVELPEAYDMTLGYYPQREGHFDACVDVPERNTWSAEVHSSPFGGCMVHGKWDQFAGLITVNDFHAGSSQERMQPCFFNGPRSGLLAGGRDHLCASGEISLDRWVFVHKNELSRPMLDILMGSIECGAFVLPRRVAERWLAVADQIATLVIALRSY